MDHMNRVFQDYLDDFVIIFMDYHCNLLDNEELLEEHLRKVLKTSAEKQVVCQV